MAKALRGEIEAELGGETRTLRLGIGDLEELEDQLDMGLPEIIRSLTEGTYRLSHLRKILTLGLNSANTKTNDDQVRSMIKATGPGDCQVICLRLFNVALGNQDRILEEEESKSRGNVSTPTERTKSSSPSGDTSKLDVA